MENILGSLTVVYKACKQCYSVKSIVHNKNVTITMVNAMINWGVYYNRYNEYYGKCILKIVKNNVLHVIVVKKLYFFYVMINCDECYIWLW